MIESAISNYVNFLHYYFFIRYTRKELIITENPLIKIPWEKASIYNDPKKEISGICMIFSNNKDPANPTQNPVHIIQEKSLAITPNFSLLIKSNIDPLTIRLVVDHPISVKKIIEDIILCI